MIDRKPFRRLDGRAAPLFMDNIDTDQIIPSREIKTVGQGGLSEGLFAGWRYLPGPGRVVNSDFILNQAGFSEAEALIAGRNFGCGSSREHAVWALREFGVRAIVAISFGEIFYGNCTRNGILPISLAPATVREFAEAARQLPAKNIIIDLELQTVRLGKDEARFEIGAYPKRLLLDGADPIDLTLQAREDIDAFEARDRRRRPWVYPVVS